VGARAPNHNTKELSILTVIGIIFASFVAALVFGSFFEWAVHCGLMHGEWMKGYPYETHDRVHHVLFDGDHNYHVRRAEDAAKVTMAWWNGPVLVMVNLPLPVLIAWALGSWWIVAGATAGFIAYYGLYEYLHWCMHVPASRWLEGTRLFRLINRHHRIHHLNPGRNLNVVLPIADLCLRTRLGRAL
jgi:hypothetical protein